MKPVFKPGQVMRMVKAGKMPDNVKGGKYRCRKCRVVMSRIETESPMFHENGMYVGCEACRENVLYLAEFPPCPGFPEGFVVDVSGERKKYPLTLNEAEDEQ